MDFPKEWLESDRLGERIISDLRLKIINGEIPIGTTLTENQVSTDFVTSRSPVREAFKILENEGLVELGRMGAKVLGLTEEDIDELYDVRFLLENFAFQRVMETFDEEKEKALTKTLQMMELAAEHDDYLEFSYYDLLFHESVIIGADHKRILYTWNNIRHILLCLLIVATKKRFIEDKDELDKLIKKHRYLIHVLWSKDSDQLYHLMEEHFIDTKNTVTDAYFNDA